MRTVLFVVVLAVALSAGACLSQRAEGQRSPTPEPPQPALARRQPVLVELFTSEGCSSCPPADRNLKFLAEQQPVAGVEVVPLAFHVDYWNTSAWKDRFSSALYTRRQEVYVERFGLDSSYTPEMVVDGKTEFVGSDTGRSVKVIGDALGDEKGSVSTSLDGDMIDLSVEGMPKHNAATVFLAVTEDGITSNVKGGENAGTNLTHAAVVRSLTSLGLVEHDAPAFAVKGTLPQISEQNPRQSHFIVFVQDNVTRRILAVGLASRS